MLGPLVHVLKICNLGRDKFQHFGWATVFVDHIHVILLKPHDGSDDTFDLLDSSVGQKQDLFLLLKYLPDGKNQYNMNEYITPIG
jgi:hypothetical protein